MVYGVLVSHGPVALAANRAQVIDICGTTFTFGNIVSHLEIKGGDYVLAPTDEAFMFEKSVTTIQEPYLLS